MSKQFRRWIEDFRPDIIYSQLSSIGTIDLVQQARKISGARIVIHMMDDWPTTIYKDKYLGFLLRAIILRKFRKILDISSSCMAISDVMANEYVKRYGRKFLTFHNPVDIQGEARVNVVRNSDLKKIVYTGRIGRVNKDSLISFARVIDEMDLNVSFCIYSADSTDEMIANDFREFGKTRLMSPVQHAQVLNILRDADLLLLPLNFDRWARDFVRLSMPTKATDYLLSGTPVLVYAPAGCALSISAKTQEWGYVVGSQDHALLKDAILKTLFDTTTRQKLSERALSVVSRGPSSDVVREKFRSALQGVYLSHG
jgi:glycosyltransferase involved in cell wall biosynthesis